MTPLVIDIIILSVIRLGKLNTDKMMMLIKKNDIALTKKAIGTPYNNDSRMMPHAKTDVKPKIGLTQNDSLFMVNDEGGGIILYDKSFSSGTQIVNERTIHAY